MDYLRRSGRVSRLQKIPNTTIRSKIQAEQSILYRIQRSNWNGMNTYLELSFAKEDLPLDTAR